MSIDLRGHITPKTPEAAYMATHAYMMATRPPPSNPRASLYQTAMAGIGVMRAAIAGREVTQEPARSPRRNSPRQGGHHRSRSPHRQHSPRQAAATTRNIQREGDTRNNTAQARVDRAREERGHEDRSRENRQTMDDGEEELCGLPCFTRRVRKTRVPASFKLPDSYKKFDGLQDPEDWLVDYLEIVKLTSGTRATAMQSIQVHLSGAARSWMRKFPEGSIDNWETFERLFVQNFKSTCKKPASIEQLRPARKNQASQCEHTSSGGAS